MKFAFLTILFFATPSFHSLHDKTQKDNSVSFKETIFSKQIKEDATLSSNYRESVFEKSTNSARFRAGVSRFYDSLANPYSLKNFEISDFERIVKHLERTILKDVGNNYNAKDASLQGLQTTDKAKEYYVDIKVKVKRDVTDYETFYNSKLDTEDIRDNSQVSSVNSTIGYSKNESEINELHEAYNGSNVEWKSKDMSLNKATSCQHVSGYSEHRYITLVVKCPEHWEDKNTRTQCENWNKLRDQNFLNQITLLPVQDTSGNVYANTFCAICHDVAPILIWKPILECDHNDDKLNYNYKSSLLDITDFPFLQQFFGNGSCSFTIKPTFPDTIKSCLNMDLKYIFLFSRGFNFVDHSELKNPTISFNLLLNFDFTGNPHIYFSASVKDDEEIAGWESKSSRCKESETYDTYSGVCRRVKCASDHRLQGKKCIPIPAQEFPNTPKDVEIVPNGDRVDLKLSLSLSLNITYGIYLEVKDEENLEEIVVKQLADQLKVDENQFTDVKVTFDFKVTNGTQAKLLTDVDEKFRSDIDTGGKEKDGIFRKSYKQEQSVKVENSKSNTRRPSKRDGSAIQDGGFKIHPRPKKVNIQTGGMESHNCIDKDVPSDCGMTMHVHFVFVTRKYSNLQRDAHQIEEKLNELISNNGLEIRLSGNTLHVGYVGKSQVDGLGWMDFCQWGQTKVFSDGKFKLVDTNGTEYLYATETRTFFKDGLYNIVALLSGEQRDNQMHISIKENLALVCVMPQISQHDCRRIDLTSDEYEINTSSKILTFEELDYNMSMYNVLNESSGLIEICIPQSYDEFTKIRPSTKPKNFISCKHTLVETIEGYITLVLGNISTLALALGFVTYCLFPTLRTIPGLCLMNLTLALFIAETVFMNSITNGDRVICTAITIILHYFFLVAHFWMNVMSFDVYRTFSKGTFSNKDRSDKRCFLMYSVYAWGMPMMIVSICVFIEFSDLFNVHIGYKQYSKVENASKRPSYHFNNTMETKNDTHVEDSALPMAMGLGNENLALGYTCWLKPQAALAAFGAPIFSIFVANCLFFIGTILSISKTVKISRASLSRQESNSSLGATSARSEVLLYLRMSTVMGLTWIFGLSSAIISAVTNSITDAICIVIYVHGILFVIVNACQGLFIFVAFLCNRRVGQMYRRLFFRLKRFIQRQRVAKMYSISSNLQSKSTDFLG